MYFFFLLSLSLEMFERKDCFVCSCGEGREKELFFIELYDFFKKKNSFRVVIVFSR